MLDLFNIAKPQGCDIQIFYGFGSSTTNSLKSWTKPRGVSNVYMILIGTGGNGDGTSGGGSGAVTVWYGSAQNVPDVLQVSVGVTNATSRIYATFSSGAVVLLSAGGTNNATGASAMTANQFAASGFFQSIAGVNGTSVDSAASTTTFLSGGAPFTGAQTSNYGYSSGPQSTDRNGFFQTQPIIVGTAGMGAGVGGIGCGGGSNATTGKGGQGLVLIASW